MQEIKAYKSTNGLIYENKESALQQDKKFYVETEIQKLIVGEDFYQPSDGEIQDFLSKNLGKIALILKQGDEIYNEKTYNQFL